jgi:hypothetical protein
MEEFDKIEPLLKDHDVVTETRAIERSFIERRQPLYRRIGSRGFAVFMCTVAGLKRITDSQCGFKFFRRHLALELFSIQKINGYMFDVVTMALATLFGYGSKKFLFGGATMVTAACNCWAGISATSWTFFGFAARAVNTCEILPKSGRAFRKASESGWRTRLN